MKKIMAKDVNEYLMEYAFALADVINDKGVPKKDKKWLQHKVICIMEVQDLLNISIAYDNVMKGNKKKKR
jgi:hypothetical protein